MKGSEKRLSISDPSGTDTLTLPSSRAALVLVSLALILLSFHFVLGVAAGTVEGEARMRQAKMDELSKNISSTAVFVLGPVLAGGVSIWIMTRIDGGPTNRVRHWLIGLVVALGTLGILFLV